MSKRYFCFTMAVVVAVLLTLAPVASARRPSARALEAQKRHTERLMGIEGVVGTAAGSDEVIVLVKNSQAAKNIPNALDGVPVRAMVSGEIHALSATGRFDRPVPIGVSTGNEGECSAGTIACRVTDGTNVYALSNNHVYALENHAPIGSKILQPGRYDTGCAFDPNNVIGTLYKFKSITFSRRAENKVDAAIALCTTGMLGSATPADGYGTPDATIVPAELGQQVVKYGRTTGLTTGQVTGVNATVYVGYSSGTARFVDQIIVESGTAFILAGDSGSLLVTDPDHNPVGLLYAGNGPGTMAVANRIDLVLQEFGVTVDTGGAVPEVTDIATTDVSAPSPVVKGSVINVNVTAANVGNQDVSADIMVALKDESDNVTIGQQTISGGLSAGSSRNLTFSWGTSGASLGDHTLTASQSYPDDNAGNDSKSTVVNVTEHTMHVASIVMSTRTKGAGRNRFAWAIATVTIVDASGGPVDGATVNGHWEGATRDSDSGTTGANGQVSLQSDSVKNPPPGTTFTFVVDTVAKGGWTYNPGANVETSDSITLH